MELVLSISELRNNILSFLPPQFLHISIIFVNHFFHTFTLDYISRLDTFYSMSMRSVAVMLLKSSGEDFHVLEKFRYSDEWIRKEGCDTAARAGSLRALRYAFEIGWVRPDDLCGVCAGVGSLDCLKYAHQNGCELDLACTEAAINGHLECLVYCHENGAFWDERTTSYASMNGHLDCLQYAHENKCEWSSRTTLFAAEEGHIDCLKYCHENGCYWNREVVEWSSLNGHLDCLEYALRNGCPTESFGVFLDSKNNINMDCLKCLVSYGVPLPKMLYYGSAKKGKLEELKYLYEKKCPLPENLLGYILARGMIDVVKLIIEFGAEYDENVFWRLYSRKHTNKDVILECFKLLHTAGTITTDELSHVQEKLLALIQYPHDKRKNIF